MRWVMTTNEAVDLTNWLINTRWPNNVIHWFGNNPVLGPTMQLADFVEVDPTNVSPWGISGFIGLPFRLPDGSIGLWGLEQLLSNGVAYPVTVNGWYMTDVTGAVLVAAGYLAFPVTFRDPLDSAIVSLPIAFPLSGS